MLSSTPLTSFLAQIPSRRFSVDEVLSPYVYVFYASFNVAFLFTPVMRSVALYYGIIDRPDNLRKIHAAPVAYLGGVAVFLGWLAGLTASQFLQLHRIEPGWPTTAPVVTFSIVFGGLIIVLLGLWDDILGVRPWVKIAGQVVAALLLLWDGVGLSATRSLLTPFATRAARTPFFADLF